jgi:tetratricopeptide (TPR) repeat protein
VPDPYEHLDAGVIAERQGALDDALAHFRAAAEADDPWLRSDALRRQASIHRNRSEWDAALALARRAVSVAAEASLVDQEAEARNAEALVHLARGEFETATAAFERVLASCNDPRIRGMALQNLGSIAAQQGTWDTARHHFNASVKCFQTAGYERGVAIAQNNYGRAALDHGHFKLAANLLAEAVWSANRTGDRDLVALATLNHAEAIAGTGDLERAVRDAEAALAHFTSAGNAWRRVECLRVLGDMARQGGEPDAARAKYLEAEALARDIGAHLELALIEKRLADPDSDAAPSNTPAPV